jgi:hypothetical protein
MEDWLRWILAAMLALASAGGAIGAEATYQVGIGVSSCGTAFKNLEFEAVAEGWILGFWTGVNLLNEQDHLVGTGFDGNSIAGEVKKLCADEPSQSLSHATVKAYQKMASKRR